MARSNPHVVVFVLIGAGIAIGVLLLSNGEEPEEGTLDPLASIPVEKRMEMGLAARSPADVHYLLDRLRFEEGMGSLRAMSRLMGMGEDADPAVVPVLLEALIEESGDVREGAARALGKVDPEALFLAAARYRGEVARRAFLALAMRQGPEGAAAVLLAAARRPEPEVRELAATWLGVLGDAGGPAEAALVELTTDSEKVVGDAAREALETLRNRDDSEPRTLEVPTGD